LDENSHIIFGGRGKGRGDMGKSHTPSTHLLHDFVALHVGMDMRSRSGAKVWY